MKEINGRKQMKDVWFIPLVTKEEKKYGKYSTQKPLALLDRIILASTKDGDLILDPFNDSVTTGISAVRLKKKIYRRQKLIKSMQIFPLRDMKRLIKGVKYEKRL